MPECMIANISVDFPYELYDAQKAYMEKVIKCLNEGTNGMLESPTGTGKTLSLLCSSLAWVLFVRKAEMQAQMQIYPGANIRKPAGYNGVFPKIIYASRTHSQLTQAMDELKRTSYSFMRAVVLGSRDQLCIQSDVMREQSNLKKIKMCEKIKKNSCPFYGSVGFKKELMECSPTMDIEDLVKAGQQLLTCPYYTARELAKVADITFMPYNYLIDEKASNLELNNAIVILDEAHNIEKLCEDAASTEICSSDIASAIDDVSYIMDNTIGKCWVILEEHEYFTIDDLTLLKTMLTDFEKAVYKIVISSEFKGTTHSVEYIYDLLQKINVRNFDTVLSLLAKLIKFMNKDLENASFYKVDGCQILENFLKIVFRNKVNHSNRILQSFKLHVRNEHSEFNNKEATGVKETKKVIYYWCFNPGYGMEYLLKKNVHSIILTSGTLAPFKPLVAELGIPISNFLENAHIVSKSQVYVKIIKSGPDREQLLSNYQNRYNPKYITSLGRTIVSFCPIIPDGLLIFFSSYEMMNKCVDSWHESGIWSEIFCHKPIFIESRDKETFNSTLIEYYAKIRDAAPKGAC